MPYSALQDSATLVTIFPPMTNVGVMPTALRAVVAMLDGRYWIGNVDLTVVGERPRIAPRRVDMRARVAEILGIDTDRVNVKATTNERLGALGRSEGLAALAVVLLEEQGSE
jgi:2-C-methyl-D-erythritol 2,4-cyclodiphosphate synthase